MCQSQRCSPNPDLWCLIRLQVLGKGELPSLPLLVKAKYFSKLAESKIKEAGGACELVA
jgi:large subunit ribosomal protein L27Ae